MKKILVKVMMFAALVSIGWNLIQSVSGLKSAPIITASALQSLQVGDWEDQLVVVDVRSKAETDISLIPGAITRQAFEDSLEQHRDKQVVVYCTVGYRSGIYAAKLRSDGINAYNYEGSILDWCANQLPVVTPQGSSTRLVHTYSANYALASGYQAVY